jgi:hypothetical protein
MRRPVTAIALPILIGCIGLVALMQRPRVQAYYAVDVLQLIVCGVCFGVALAAIFLVVRGPAGR